MAHGDKETPAVGVAHPLLLSHSVMGATGGAEGSARVDLSLHGERARTYRGGHHLQTQCATKAQYRMLDTHHQYRHCTCTSPIIMDTALKR